MDLLRPLMNSDHYYFHIFENGLSIPDDEGMFLSARGTRRVAQDRS